MHIGFLIFISIGHFWLASLASLAAYIPAQVWDQIDNLYWTRRQRRIKVYYDKNCEFCLKTCLILREFFLPHDVSIAPAQDTPLIGDILIRKNSWVVVTPAECKLLHWDALVYITKQSVLMRPIWLIVFTIRILGMGNKIYDLIGRSRLLLSRMSAAFLPFNDGVKPVNKLTTAGLALVVAICFTWNVDQNRPQQDRAYWLEKIGPTLSKVGLTQRWAMFAPFPSFIDGYPVISVLDTTNEERFLTPSGEIRKELKHPERLEKHFYSYRWRKYLNRIAWYEGEMRNKLFERFAKIQCKELITLLKMDRFKSQRIKIQWASNLSFKQKEDAYSLETIGIWKCRLPDN